MSRPLTHRVEHRVEPRVGHRVGHRAETQSAGSWLLGALALAPLAGLLDARGQPGTELPNGPSLPPLPAGGHERLGDPTAELARAARLKALLRGAAGLQRELRRQEAVEAYRSAASHWPGTREASEASFRAGELLRAADLDADAAAEFERAAAGAEGEFPTRARLELGHLARRAKRLGEALSFYGRVRAESQARAALRDEAGLWMGRVSLALGRSKEARDHWLAVAEGGDDPVDRIEAWDECACSWIADQALEEAAAALQRCREALADAALEETALGDRTRRALARMRAPDQLRDAIDARERLEDE